MNDKKNNYDLFVKRLEEFHIEETSSGDILSDEDLLRWERMAKVRRAEKARKTKTYLSAAAVLLLAIILGTAIAIGPPDVHAGGEGGSVIVDGVENGMVTTTYKSIEEIPEDVKEKIQIIDDEKYDLKINTINHTKSKSITQVEIVYEDIYSDKIMINYIISENDINLDNRILTTSRKKDCNGVKVYITDDEDKSTYFFVYGNSYGYIFCENSKEKIVLEIIEETF